MSEPAERQSETSRFAQDLVKTLEILSVCGTAEAKKTQFCPKELTRKPESGEPMLIFDVQEMDNRATQEVYGWLLNCFKEHFPENAGSFNDISSIMEDRYNNLWFGTSNRGAIMFDGKTFTQYSEKEGLSSNVVTPIEEDSQGLPPRQQ